MSVNAGRLSYPLQAHHLNPRGQLLTHPLSCVYFVTLCWMIFSIMDWEYPCDSFPPLSRSTSKWWLDIWSTWAVTYSLPVEVCTCLLSVRSVKPSHPQLFIDLIPCQKSRVLSTWCNNKVIFCFSLSFFQCANSWFSYSLWTLSISLFVLKTSLNQILKCTNTKLAQSILGNNESVIFLKSHRRSSSCSIVF